MEHQHYRRALSWARKICTRYSAEPDAVVANSYAGLEFHRRLGYAPRAWGIIPNGIDTERFKPDPAARAQTRAQLGISDAKPLIVHVARVDPMKDHAGLVSVAKSLPDVEFVMVGLGTQNIAGPDNLHALGARQDLPALYAAADLALSTSAFGEGFPSVVAEAMASGVPVVGTDVGDTRRIIGTTGAVVPPRNPAALSAAVSALLQESKDRWTSRSKAARDCVVARYSLERAVAAFDALHLRNVLPAVSDDT